MNFSLAQFSKNLFSNLLLSVKRFPLPILSALFASIFLMIVAHMEGDLVSPKGVLIQRIAMIFALGFPVMLGLTVALERNRQNSSLKSALVFALGTLALLLYFTLAFRNLMPESIIRYVVITLAAYMIAPSIPFLFKREHFERFVIFIISRLALTGVYALVLYLGFIAILFTINTLFSAGISNNLYLDLFIASIGIFAPSFFLAGIPRQDEEIIHTTSFPKALKILLLYILIPLLTVYTLILYAYCAKILVSRVWPEGMVGNLVIWYAGISLGAIFLVYPLKDSEKVANWFTKLLPLAILPLIIMMFVSMGIRINNYGITEGRYFVLVLGGWLFSYMVLLGFIPKMRNIFLPFSFAILALLTLVGPWSCFSISMKSQNARLEKLLSKNNLLQNGQIVKASGYIMVDDRKEISNILAYFNEFHSFNDIKVLPKNFNYYQTEKVFGFNLYEDKSKNHRNTNYFYLRSQDENILPTKSYSYFIDATHSTPESWTLNNDSLRVEYNASNGTLQIKSSAAELYSTNVWSLATKIVTANPGSSNLSLEKLKLMDGNEKVETYFIFRRIQGSMNKQYGKAEFEKLEFYMFFSLKK